MRGKRYCRPGSISYDRTMEGDALNHGGEFVSPDREAEFRADRLAESVRYLRLVLLAAFAINAAFYLNDWRFFGQPHFWVAMAGRSVIVGASLLCLPLTRHASSFARLEAVCLVWAVPVIVASAVLVTAGGEAALFIIFVLPVIFYLTLPVRFRWAAITGLCCSLATLAGYSGVGERLAVNPGLFLGVLTLNAVLALVVSRSNRLRHLEWSAARAERAINQELVRERETLQAILKAVPLPLVITSREDGGLIGANEAAHTYFGPGMLAGVEGVAQWLDEDERARLATALQRDGGVAEFETRLRLDDDTAHEVLLQATTATLSGVEAVLTVVVDITRRKEAEAHLEWMATTDALTGLANRARFFTLANAEIRRAHRYQRPLAVMMIDIDLFKRINDTLGHEAGDGALVAFARLCQSMVRDQDVVGRVGGEEFAVLLPETDQAAALVLADRLRAEVERLAVPNLRTAMTVSIGLSEVWTGETAIDAALSRADQALYAAKRSGRNRTVPFTHPGIAAPAYAE